MRCLNVKDNVAGIDGPHSGREGWGLMCWVGPLSVTGILCPELKASGVWSQCQKLWDWRRERGVQGHRPTPYFAGEQLRL